MGKKWLDNFGKEDNYNDHQTHTPEGFVGEGTFNGPKFNNPAWGGQFQMGGSIPGAVGFSYARTGSIPSNGKYAKKTMASAQNGKEMQYYQQGLDFQPKTISKNGAWLNNYEDGGIIKDDRGQWDHPGEITEILGDTMATHGYGNIPLYVVPDKGKPRLVQPNTGTQKFPGAKKFTEYPIAKNGLRQEQKGLQNLDNLTNFTNYNTKQPGGWMDQI